MNFGQESEAVVSYSLCYRMHRIPLIINWHVARIMFFSLFEKITDELSACDAYGVVFPFETFHL